MAEPMISLQGVTKRFPNTSGPAVGDLSFDVAEGEMVALVGPSGCGKTTTLKMINRLIEPSGGTILVNGVDVLRQDPVQLRRGIGYVIQSVGLMPHQTIARNIATVPHLLGWEEERIRARTDELVALFDLDPELPRPLPGRALRRAAAARRGRPRARGRPRRDADGRALRRRRPDRARAAAGRVPGHPAAAAQDDRVRHARHRRGDQARRSDLHPQRGRACWSSTHRPRRSSARRRTRSWRAFVGSERGLKRLALIRVADIRGRGGPGRAARTPRPRRHVRVIERRGFGWASVVDDGELRGWVDAEALARAPGPSARP